MVSGSGVSFPDHDRDSWSFSWLTVVVLDPGS